MRAYHLQVLGLNEGANDIEIKSAYRRLSKLYHPDINAEAGARDRFLQIKEAYEYLSQTPHLQEAASQYTYKEEVLSDREIWRREYLRKKRAEGIEAKKRRDALMKKLARSCAPIMLVALIFNTLLSIDYILPLSSHTESLIEKEVKSYGGKSVRHGGGRKTYHIVLRFTDLSSRASIKDDDYFVVNDLYLIKTTPILSIPRYMTNINQEKKLAIEPNFGIYRIFGFLIPISLLLSGLFFKFKKPNDQLNMIILVFFIFFVQLLLFFV